MTRWIVGSAWPYINGTPHLGTFIHLLSADVYSRYLRLKGDEVVSVSGSDEHGTPIEVEATKLGVSPKVLTDRNHTAIVNLMKEYMVELDNYTRTESPVHIAFSQEFYSRLYRNGYVTTESVPLPFCPRDERFLPDRFVEGVCPFCDFDGARGDQCDSCGHLLEPVELKNPRCAICGTAPVIKESKHWIFELPKLSARLKAYVDSCPQFPDNAKNFSYRWLEEGLRPRPLTRDNKWGIPAPFPGSEGKTIYVWMEAVLGYVSATKEWAERVGKADAFEAFWKGKDTKTVIFMGKDNIPFHTIILPALLMAAEDGYVLPWQVSSTEFILFEGQKFSKSKNVGIWMDEAAKIADPEYWRFVLMAIRPQGKDANFGWSELDRLVNSDLNDVLGNYVHRTLTFIKNNFNSAVPEPGPMGDPEEALLRYAKESSERYVRLMDDFDIRDALKEVVELARKGNEFISIREPWAQVKKDRVAASTTVYVASQLAYSIAIMLYPFMPKSSSRLCGMLGLPLDPVGLGLGKLGTAALEPGHRIGLPSPLFSKIKVPVTS
jgi:methionyl-tRNA synthetase